MKVKVGDRVFDANDVPICLWMDEADKERISSMPQGIDRYALCPGDWTEEEMFAWMDDWGQE
ncbi:MAG: hypothetical protein AAGN66_17900 [Acidobacteriota bacterium]